MPHNLSISFVLPCLNEEATLPYVLAKIVKVCQEALSGYPTEIILSDNGSTDRSREIAQSFGVRVVNCPIKGYGAALKYGISKATHQVIVFADADDTYDFSESPALIHEIEKGYDLVIGSRMKGKIYPNAMPFLHRYLGTPVLNHIINRLYSVGAYRISDCNSGFRCFRKDAYEQWGVESDGMEFASEMLIKAMKHCAAISEVPVSLYPDHPERKPHLKTWRDGMRHFLQIFVEAPFFFKKWGVILFSVNFILLLICLATREYIYIGGMALFGIHTMLFAMLGTLLGQSLWGIGLFISVKSREAEGVYAKVINLSEDILFWSIVGLITFSAICFGWIILTWAMNGFVNISLQKETLFFIAIASNGINFLTNIFTAHLLKRA